MQGMLEELRDLFKTSVAGPQTALGRKGKGERKFLFIFRKHFRDKQNNLEIAR
jgi:hypothetical protein